MNEHRVAAVALHPTRRAGSLEATTLQPKDGLISAPVTDRLAAESERQAQHVNNQVIRLLVVDDNTSLREMVSRLLNGLEGIAVVGQCSDGSEATLRAAQLRPDVVLMDMNMPVMQGPEATRRLLQSQPTVRVLMLSVSRSPEDLIAAQEAGAAGYLVKDGNIGSLVAAIQTVAAGGTAWPATPPPTTALSGRGLQPPTFMAAPRRQWY